MRCDFNLKVSNLDKALSFYVKELHLFEKSHDYGMGTILIRNVSNKNCCLLLKEDENFKNAREDVLFTISVDDAQSLFRKFNLQDFNSGGRIVHFENTDAFFEYPLGKTFVLQEPDGNRFSICEWHESAL